MVAHNTAVGADAYLMAANKPVSKLVQDISQWAARKIWL